MSARPYRRPDSKPAANDAPHDDPPCARDVWGTTICILGAWCLVITIYLAGATLGWWQ